MRRVLRCQHWLRRRRWVACSYAHAHACMQALLDVCGLTGDGEGDAQGGRAQPIGLAQPPDLVLAPQLLTKFRTQVKVGVGWGEVGWGVGGGGLGWGGTRAATSSLAEQPARPSPSPSSSACRGGPQDSMPSPQPVLGGWGWRDGRLGVCGSTWATPLREHSACAPTCCRWWRTWRAISGPACPRIRRTSAKRCCWACVGVHASSCTCLRASQEG